MSDELKELEECILTIDDAKNLANDYNRYGDAPLKKTDPFNGTKPHNKKIPYSLLSAEHIRDYVSTTGLIAPFYINGGKKSRLKDAAYEGRIGKVAYQYMPRENFPKIVFTEGDKFLKVPKNSIVFVECDLDFRLPEFIALRFNLQIKHVHRGLLLGTGPLVDPGYWGKLCIPLHNLTDEDYYIEKDDGLIWLEFTKTTSNLEITDNRIGRPPLGKEFWDIKEFLTKATKPCSPSQGTVGIRSAIPTMFMDAVETARRAEISAESAEKSVEWTKRFGFIAAAGVVLGVISLWLAFWFGLSAQYDSVRSRVDTIQQNLSNAGGKIQFLDSAQAGNEEALLNYEDALNKALSRIAELEQKNIYLTDMVGNTSELQPVKLSADIAGSSLEEANAE